MNLRCVVVALLLHPILANAQTDPAELHPGVVRPVLNPAVDIANAPLAERQQAMAQLNRVLAALQHAPALSAPVGYDVSFRRSLHFEGRAEPMQGGISAILFLYEKDQDTGKLVPGEEGPGLGVNINEPFGCVFADYHQPYMEDDSGRVYFEPKPDGTEHGYPHYPNSAAGGCTLVSSINRPLWLPVSRERVLKPMIEKQRAGLVEVRDMIARLKVSLPNGVPADVATQLKEQETRIHALEAEFAAMSPAERASQAYFWPDSHGLTPIVGAGHEGATALVAPNPAYLAGTPRTAIQTVSLWLDMPETYQWYTPFKGQIFQKIRDGLDWDALAALVRK